MPRTITLAAVLLPALAAAQQTPVIRVPVRLVTVPALVFSVDHRPIPGLAATDFHLFDNGRPQTITLASGGGPVSIALAIQANRDVRSYLPFIAKTGSAVDSLLVGESGESAVIAYNREVAVLKPFGEGSVPAALSKIAAVGDSARMIDAGLRAIALLQQRPVSRSRVLLFIGQALDKGSEARLDLLREWVESENVLVLALTLPEFGRAFVSDTFSLQGVPGPEKGGFRAGVELGKLIAVLDRASRIEKGSDPFSILTAATGGVQLHFRQQKELENGIAEFGVQLRSGYLLSYYPDSVETGYHTIRIEVAVPGAVAHARPGYRLSAN